MKRIRLTAALAGAALALSACGGALQRPEIDLEGVSVGSLGLSGGTLIASVRVRNPNRFSVRADDLRYRLFLRQDAAEAADTSWVSVADGVYGDTLSVRAGETRTFRIPVEFRYSSLAGAARNLLSTGRVQYRAEGTVDVRTPLGGRDAVPFRKTGSFMVTGGGGIR